MSSNYHFSIYHEYSATVYSQFIKALHTQQKHSKFYHYDCGMMIKTDLHSFSFDKEQRWCYQLKLHCKAEHLQHSIEKCCHRTTAIIAPLSNFNDSHAHTIIHTQLEHLKMVHTSIQCLQEEKCSKISSHNFHRQRLSFIEQPCKVWFPSIILDRQLTLCHTVSTSRHFLWWFDMADPDSQLYHMIL